MHLLDEAYEEGKKMNIRSNSFAKQWHEICDRLSLTFNMDMTQKKILKDKPVAKLIGAIPFLAGCNNELQSATTHLATYLLSVSDGTKSIYYHQEWTDDNDIMRRLEPISYFDGGDEVIICRGMDLLALNMIAGYARDIKKDLKNGKYNPVAIGRWGSKKIIVDLIERIQSVDCPEMDAIMDPDVATDVFWGM